MSNLDAQIRAKVTHPPTVTSEGAGAARANEWASQASAALLAALELHKPTEGRDGAIACSCMPDSSDPYYSFTYPCPTLRGIAEKLGIEVDHG